MAAIKYWLWLSCAFGAANRTMLALLERFSSPEDIYYADKAEFEDMPGLDERSRQLLGDKSMTRADKVLADCERLNLGIVTLQDAEYPDRLKNIFDPPAVLYTKGQFPVFDEEATIAIVGTRSCTPYGIKASESIAYEIASGGGLVATGLADGCDSAAARGALKAGGRVAGVLGNGIDVIYPRGNGELYNDVAASGVLISEYPPGFPVSGKNFPIRNRIISGLSLGVLVTEAPVRSGALITANDAADQGRDVFVVPANINARQSEGSNNLLRQGAIAVTNGRQVLAEYEMLYPLKLRQADRQAHLEQMEKIWLRPVKRPVQEKASGEKMIDKAENRAYIDLIERIGKLDGDEKTVAALLVGRMMHIDDIVELSGLEVARVLAALTMLEISDLVRQDGEKVFTLTAEQE